MPIDAVVAMLVVLAVVAGVVVAVLVEMRSRSWRWAPKMIRTAREVAQYLSRRAGERGTESVV